MLKSRNKLIIILVSLALLSLGLTTSSAINIQKNQMNEQDETYPDFYIDTESIKIYRYGPDGSIEQIEIDIELEKGQDINDALIAKCDELLENDEEIQQIINEENNKSIFGFISRIQSSGKGLHYKTMLFEKLYVRYLIWKLQLPRIAPFIARPFVFCRYGNDYSAKTIIQPILLGNKTAPRIIEGTHSVFVNSFIGFSSWFGRFSYSTILPRAFSGYARFAFCNKLK